MVLFTLLGALPFSVIIYFRFTSFPTNVNLLMAILLSLLVGFLFHTLILLFLKIRFNNTSSNADFLNLISRVHQKVVIPRETRVWVRRSNEEFIASAFNPFFDAIIVSEPMVDLFLKSPDSGEVLLAFHFLRVPRTRWFGDLVGSAILFSLLTTISSLFLVPSAYYFVWAILNGDYYVLYMMTSFATILMGPIIFVYLVKGIFWRHETAFVATQDIYGMHPNVAKVQVEKGIILTEDETQSVIWAVREWEKRKRSSRRWGVVTSVATMVFVLGLYLYFLIGPMSFSSLYILISYLPLILAALAALVSYYLLKRWDNNAMGEVFQKTTDYDEPIWVD